MEDRKLPLPGEALEGIDVTPSTETGKPPEVSPEERIYEKKTTSKSINQQLEFAHLRGIQDHYKLKKQWSLTLTIALGFMIGFQSLLLGMVGSGWWDFSEYTWLLPALLVQNLGQIIGLVVIVVKSLFN